MKSGEDISVTSPTSVDYVLYYWGIPFRGNFLMLPLEDVGASYELRNSRELYPEKRLSVRHPGMAPPFLYERASNTHYNQMPACLMHLGRAHGLLPEDPSLQTLALKVILDCDDVLMEITRHNGMLMWDREAWTKFRGQRLPTWMRIFEGISSPHGLRPDAGYMLGSEVSVADYATATLFGSMVHSFPQLRADLEDNAPGIAGLCRRMESRSAIRAFLEAQRADYGLGYCGGQIERSIRSMFEAPGDG